ncbi:hypothetical protein TNCV_1841571 [Trichonephila clavipes]|nr:hypothetical protein TNCV_1841571 [Trichonephila clavipes]
MMRTFCLTVTGTPCNTAQQRLGRISISPHLLVHTPRLAQRPPGGCHYRDFHQRNVVRAPLFNVDLSASCCLLLPLSICQSNSGTPCITAVVVVVDNATGLA